ncbi:MAG: serine/threonine-protein kinase [Pseudomonadota bacterium]
MTPRVGPYRVSRLLNSGGQGSVYLGQDDRLGRPVAIKVYALPADRQQQKRLLHRARLVASIQNQRVVQVHDVILSREHLALIMEYVPGVDLESVLKHRRPDLATVLAIATQTAGAIAAARQKRIVHGDIKPANLLINTAGQVKLTDFGIATPSGAQSRGEGSPASLAPEQLLADTVDVRTDLFALGCLLYRLIAGCPPWPDAEALDLERRLNHPPEPLSRLSGSGEVVPEALAELVADLLRPNPEDRPSNTHSVRQILRDIGKLAPARADNPVATFAGPWLQTDKLVPQTPQIPMGLRRQRRSALLRGSPWESLLGLWRFGTDWQRGALIALLPVSLALGIGVAAWLWPGREPLMLVPPRVELSADVAIPVSSDWLMTELESALRARFGEAGLVVSEAIRPRPVLYRSGREPNALPPRRTLQLGLACSPNGCLLELRHDDDGRQRRAQALVLADAPAADWRRSMGESLDLLLDGESTTPALASWSGPGVMPTAEAREADLR